MSTSSNVSLGALRLQAQQRADLEGSPAIPTSEWNAYLSNSYKRLYNKLVAAYGNDYYVQTPYQFTISSTSLYPLPSDFFKLIGVDLQYSASPTGWVTLKKYEFIERNKYSWLNPLPISASLVQLWYVPEPTPLQFFLTSATTVNSTTVAVSDVSDLTVGMSIYGGTSGPIPANTTITAINTSLSQITISNAALSTQPVVILQAWIDSATLDGISGWDEYVILDAAIKAKVKQEEDTTDLRIDLKRMEDEIEALAEGRDAGQAHHVSDVMSVNTPIVSIGATNLKYHLLGSQIQFIPAGFDDYTDGYAGMGGY